MAIHSILWTPLPNGFDSHGNLRLSILASPRLDAQTDPEVLSTFDDFVDWPATLAQSKITIRYGTHNVTIAGDDVSGQTRIDDRFGLPDSTVWSHLLPGGTFVRGFAFDDRSASRVLSYSTNEIANTTRHLYSRLAASAGDDLPEIQSLLKDTGWKSFADNVEQIDRRFIETRDGLPRNIEMQFDDYRKNRFEGLPTQARQLATFQLFHTPPGTPDIQKYDNVSPDDPKSRAKWRTFKRHSLPNPDELAKRYDFHQIVAAMNQYPTLLRRMGLVIDVLIEPGLFSHANDALLGVAVQLPDPAGSSAATRKAVGSPLVHCRLGANRFNAVPRPNPHAHDYQVSNGLLRLDRKRFTLLQVDVDGAGLKTMNIARSLRRIEHKQDQKDPTSRHERAMGVPALRNAGLMLVQRHRGSGLEKTFGRAKSVNNKVESNQSPELYAEDLVRGFRVDVWDDRSKLWHSLCERTARYEISGLPPIEVDREEGTVRLAATQSADENSNPDMIWLHEMLMSWTGWSLCAPMPGRTIDPNDQVADSRAEVPDGIPLSTEFRVLPNSLPRLRLGRHYWIRARTVDLASNSLPPTEKTLGTQLPENNAEAYLRFDPVKAPTLALVKPTPGTIEEPAEGESMERLAIRTFNDTPEKNSEDSKQVTRRFVLPDSASVKDAELHGMLDADGKMDPGFYGMLASKDSQLEEESVASPPPLVPVNPSLPPAETRYAVLQDGAEVPYLPDPLCVELAARIFDLPGHDDEVIIPIPVYADGGKWPNALPFKIVILEKPGVSPKFNIEDRELVVPLPKAARAKLRLSVKLSMESLQLLGIWQWLTPEQQEQMEQKALSGQHWMLTPWRTIELVHAVQKPLITPDFKVRIDRRPNETFAVPTIDARVSLKSTQQVDLMAEWNEPVVDPSAPPENRSRKDRAYTVKITDPQSYAGIPPDHRILKPDLIRAGSRGHELMAEKVHEFEDTRYRRIVYWLEATTRFREYMPPDVLTEIVDGDRTITDRNIKVLGKPVETWIRNSAPPPAPEVLYVVPTFHWVRTATSSKKKSWRRGGGLRVYLDRPWNVSGYGEMLAVVLPSAALGDQDPNTSPTNQPVKPFVTQWGNDPAWKSPYVRGSAPKRGDFPLARTGPDPDGNWLPDFAPAEEAHQPEGKFKTGSLAHPQIVANNTGKNRVEIAPHDVQYDAERDLWYCDIEIRPGRSYFPFVRMALARYQPVSVDSAHLSNIVLADFMTLTPDRWLTVNSSNDPLVRSLAVHGNTYSASSGHEESRTAPQMMLNTPAGPRIIKAPDVSRKSVIEVWVERYDPALGEDFGWKKEDDAVVTVQRPRPRLPLTEVRRTRLATERKRARKLEIVRDFSKILKSGLIDRIVTTPTLWTGSIRLPELPSTDVRFRLVIEEYEEYLTDDETPYNLVPTTKGRRRVFIEHVELEP